MKGKKILIAITGSIAAYKIPLLVRLLIKAGAEVKVVMTPSAGEFVSPLVLSTLSKNPVLTSLQNDQEWSNHVMLGRWADLMIVCPLSVNTLAKMAHGICDNLLMAVYLSATCPVWVAPAMDEDMWLHPSTQSNLTRLTSYQHRIIPCEYGELGSGLIGMGRMASPESIFGLISEYFTADKPLRHKVALVTAGPTYEKIDPVRFIGNHSSGKMGVAIAKELQEAGCLVHLVHGPGVKTPLQEGIVCHAVEAADEMYAVCMNLFPHADITVKAAAVADYKPSVQASQKIKKSENTLELILEKNKDILKALGEQKRENQLLIGFALETNNEEEYAKKKLKEKYADVIVMNSLAVKGAGFGSDTNQVTIFHRDGDKFELKMADKKIIAKQLTEKIISWIL